ncbi:hypothetical protein FZEAL_3494 [Fusarium zealandicum]|uniref:Glycan binding protein Y3-like domain-containing protein n=1 Tax=Fusarium zealandicum TaxID=1053134 RepID=A0A8H4UPE7_9HYPO|nr:hypothetical protein FZEAL_3494 [Fusarium zealandicum]
MRSFACLLAGLTLVLGKCHTSGAEWATQRTFALTKAREVCELKFSINRWSAGEALGACYNLDSTKKVDLVLERISTGDDEREISVDECFDGFQKEINGCDQGGVSSYTNWKYSGDANAGQCNADN